MKKIKTTFQADVYDTAEGNPDKLFKVRINCCYKSAFLRKVAKLGLTIVGEVEEPYFITPDGVEHLNAKYWNRYMPPAHQVKEDAHV